MGYDKRKREESIIYKDTWFDITKYTMHCQAETPSTG